MGQPYCESFVWQTQDGLMKWNKIFCTRLGLQHIYMVNLDWLQKSVDLLILVKIKWLYLAYVKSLKNYERLF